jgi:hypothetical protein
MLLQNGAGEPPDTTGGSTRGAAAMPARYDQAAMRRLMAKKHETLDDLGARRKKVTHHSLLISYCVYCVHYCALLLHSAAVLWTQAQAHCRCLHTQQPVALSKTSHAYS